MPDDLVPILAKDEEKQRAIREKANKDAASTQARAIGATTPANASRGTQVAAAKITVDANRTKALAPAVKTAAPNVAPPQSAALAQKSAATVKPAAASASAKNPSGKNTISMVIQAIPPFKGPAAKSRQSSGPASAAAPSASVNGKVTVNTTGPSASNSNNTAHAAPMSPATAANRLNVNASSFRPNPKANAFTPVTLMFLHADG